MTAYRGQPNRAGHVPFVGRSDELGTLRSGLDAAAAGAGRLFLIGGEPGIGKTRLAQEIAAAAVDRGFEVYWGRCWEEEGAPAFWPWIQILRSFATDREAEQLATLTNGSREVLAGLVAELDTSDIRTESFGDRLMPSTLESERNRFLILDAVAQFLARASRQVPLLLILDDLHAADASSLRLLHFLARAIGCERICILVTYRAAEVRLEPELADRFAALDREATSIELAGWPRADVEAFVHAIVGPRASGDLIDAILDITCGNPLFVDGFVREIDWHADATGSGARSLVRSIPDSVRATIQRRVRLLPTAQFELLTVASVVGDSFDARLLQAVTGDAAAEILDRLQKAAAADLLEAPSAAEQIYSFAHPLLRSTLYTDLAPKRRQQLHHRAARALEAYYGDRRADRSAEIAHHYFEAALADDVPKAIGYAVRAAERAEALCAFEKAAALYERALGALALATGDHTVRGSLLVRLAEVHVRAGSFEQARLYSVQAAELARDLADGELLARAALAFGGITIGVGIVDDELIGLLEEALEMLGAEPTTLRAIVAARLAVRLHGPEDGPRRVALCAEAAQAARAAGSQEALAHVYDAEHLAMWDSSGPAGQLERAEALTAAATACGSRELMLHGHALRVADYLELGDINAVRREIAEYERLAEDLFQPYYSYRAKTFRAMLALTGGDTRRAEHIALEAAALRERAQNPIVPTHAAVQALALERLRGSAGPAEALIREQVDAYPTVVALRGGLAALYCDLEREVEVAMLYEPSAGAEFRDIPTDNNWLIGVALMAEACHQLRDRTGAQALLAMLAPFADRNPVGASGSVCNGSACRPVGLLYRVLGQPRDALAYFDRAIAADQRIGGRPSIARTALDAAETLAEGEAPPDRIAAYARQALDLARAIGMAHIERRALRLLDRTSAPERPASTPTATPTATPTGRNILRRDGEYWTLAYEGREFRLRDIRGLAYLASLLAAPGEERHCLTLDGGSVPPAAAPEAMLDSRAKAAYAERIRELHAEVEEAESFNDPFRATRAREELDALGRELGRAVGLGKRDRSSGSAAERARVRVTKALRLALSRIAAQDEELADHLRATLRTGAYCSYQPDPRSQAHWTVEPGG